MELRKSVEITLSKSKAHCRDTNWSDSSFDPQIISSEKVVANNIKSLRNARASIFLSLTEADT